jgi:hypothetical protein
MAGIKAPILAVLQQLSTVNVINADGFTVPLYARIWNKQVDWEIKGTTYLFPKPAAFVEVVNNVVYEQAGVGYRSANLLFRIHLVMDQLDAGDELTLEQNTDIFDLRDTVTVCLANFRPAACDQLIGISEAQQYGHTNIYEYILEFTCNFIDSKASPYDPQAGKYIQTTGATEGVISATFSGYGTEGPSENLTQPPIIPHGTFR